MTDLLINEKDAFATWGVRMGEGFLDVIGASAPMKDFISNKQTDILKMKIKSK